MKKRYKLVVESCKFLMYFRKLALFQQPCFMIRDLGFLFKFNIIAKDVLIECVPIDLMGMPRRAEPMIVTVFRDMLMTIVDVTRKDLSVPRT